MLLKNPLREHSLKGGSMIVQLVSSLTGLDSVISNKSNIFLILFLVKFINLIEKNFTYAPRQSTVSERNKVLYGLLSGSQTFANL